MGEELDQAANAFSAEIRAPEPASPPRDQAGRFVQVSGPPEPLFGERTIEGDELTGDTSDGGDDPRLRQRERDLADGRIEQGRRTAEDRKDLRRTSGDDDERVPADDEQADETAVDESDAAEVDEGPRYEVTVDGAVREVSLQEALRGYVRQATFHQRMTQLNQVQTALEEEAKKQDSNWGLLLKARQDYEEDLVNLTPKEPNWDQEFAVDARAAHAQQKIFQTIYDKLAQSRNYRAQMEAQKQAETDRRVQKYAVDGFSKFVMSNKIDDEPTLNKELQSMRRTAAAAGFSEYEVATVYDPRMLTILRKASKYDRMMATAKPKAVVPGKGKTLAPGAATPLGNVRRSGYDDAQRRLASSGKLSDAVDVFRRIL